MATQPDLVAGTIALLNTALAGSVLSLVGVFVGAWLAAWLAARFSDRSKVIEELGKEMRATQVAVSLAHVTCNAALNLKQQHLRAMARQYATDRARCVEHREAVAAGSKREPLAIALDLRTLPPLNAPVRDLLTMCQDRTNLIGRPLAMALVLADTAAQVERLIDARNRQVEGFKARGAMDAVSIAMYFGFPLELREGGRILNEEYRDTMTGLTEQLDNMLFFCRELNDDLATHGDSLKRQWATKTKRKAPPVGRVDYSGVEAGVFPDRNDFPSWIGWSDGSAAPRQGMFARLTTKLKDFTH